MPVCRAVALFLLLTPGVAIGADAVDGETVARAGNGRGAVACASCHGPDGAGNGAAGFPRIAGQDAGYIAAQLTAIRDGERASPVMAPILESLTEVEIASVADYYAALPVPDIGAEPSSDPRTGERLSRVGDWPGRDLPACSSCHGPGARGVNASFPGLAGQHASYLKAQLEAFRSGARATDPGDLMGSVARKLTDEEMVAVSDWLAAQPARRAEVK